MIPTTVNIYQVDATFDALTGDLTLTGEEVVDGGVKVPQGIHIITFTLKTTVDPGFPDKKATFESFPLSWEKLGVDNILPGIFTTKWWDPTHCSLVVFNVNNAIHSFSESFSMTLYYRNIARKYDPTIINEPPDGGS